MQCASGLACVLLGGRDEVRRRVAEENLRNRHGHGRLCFGLHVLQIRVKGHQLSSLYSRLRRLFVRGGATEGEVQRRLIGSRLRCELLLCPVLAVYTRGIERKGAEEELGVGVLGGFGGNEGEKEEIGEPYQGQLRAHQAQTVLSLK